MTNQLKVSSILLLLSITFCQIKNETPLTTESDAEEEEEKMVNIVNANESSLQMSSMPPMEDTSNPVAEDELDSKKNNVWWENDTNATDYDEIQEEKKDDASPKNSVDKNLLENVGDFLSDHLGQNVSLFTDFKRVLSSTSAKSYLSDVIIFPTPSQDTIISSTTSTCNFGDRKCNQLFVTSDFVSKHQEVFQPTVTSFIPLQSDEVLTSSKISASETTENSNTSSDVKIAADYVLFTHTESTTAQTSDNIIIVEHSDEAKDEIVIQGQLNKSDKSKQVLKQRDSLFDASDEIIVRTVLKSSEVTPLLSVEKEYTSSWNTPSDFSTLLSKMLSSASTPSPFSDHVTPVKSSSKVPFVLVKTDTNTFSEDIEHAKKFEEISSVNHKTPLESNNIIPTFSTASWENRKSSFSNDDKYANEEKLLSVLTLTSSFSESPISTTRNVPEETPYFPSQKKSQVEIDSSFMSKHTATSPILSSKITPTAIFTENTLSGPKETEKKERLPPPRLTNPGCSSLPVCVEVTLLETTVEQFCSEQQDFLEFLSKSLSHYTRPIHSYHIVLDTEACSQSSALRSPHTSPDLTVAFYVVNDSGEYEERMTEISGLILRKWAPSAFKSSVLEVRMYIRDSQSTPLPIIPELNSGFVAAVSISAVAGVALCLLCILLVIMKQKLMQGRNSDTTTPTVDAYSLDSLSISASFRRRRVRRSARSYLNHAFNDQEIPSHPLNEKTLMNCLKSKDLLEEEFKRIPMTMPKLDSIPEGAHAKNRYSNILPKAESRVVLADPSGDPLKCYINANFVKGYAGKSAFYIACQAPLPEGIEDFWRMVWEQQSRVIIMLTLFEENGISRCAIYFPQSTLITQQPFGDFQVSLLKKDVYEFYTLSTLRLLDLEKNLFRDIVHLWFTSWPDVGVPKDPSSLVTFVQQCRPFINCNTGPTVVHCSTGTGRTGVFLALDICMREYDESRSIDILQCISQLRRDRAGAVQNKDQYILIHEAMQEYITRVNNQLQRPSISS